MKYLNSTTFTTRKLAGFLTAACCIWTVAMTQAAEAEVQGSANGGLTLQAAQSGDDATSPAAGTDASADLQASTAVKRKGARAGSEGGSAASVDGATSAGNESRLAGDASSSLLPPSDDALAAVHETVAGVAETAATMAEAIDASVLDTAVDSAVQSEIAAAVESSVQGDIQSAIENDLATEVTESLPLP
jgi:hypothetical protein